MPATLSLPAPLLDATRTFLAEQGIPLAVAAAPAEGALAVVLGDRTGESEPDRLVAGGRIRCALALGLAGRLGLQSAQVGALLDHLDVKVHACSLGCF